MNNKQQTTNNKQQTSNLIKISIGLALTISLAFFACKRTVDYDFNQKTVVTTGGNVGNETMSYSSQDSIIIDSLSTLTANLINSMNQLNQSDFCSLKTILESNENTTNKYNSIQNVSGLNVFYNSMLEFNAYTSNVDVNPYLAIQDNKVMYTNFIQNKIDLLETPYRPNIDCNGYLAAHQACRDNFLICSIAAILAGGPVGAISVGLCGLALMKCVDTNDVTNPECAKLYGFVLPNIISRNVSSEDICK